MSKSSKKLRPHIVDEITETVYLTVSSWSSALAAPHWTRVHYPGYKCVIVTEHVLKDKQNDKT